MLRWEGWHAGRNLIYRLYREEGLVLKRKGRVAARWRYREDKVLPLKPNQAWAPDLVHEQFTNGQEIRALTVVDIHTRGALAMEVSHCLRAEHVVNALN